MAEQNSDAHIPTVIADELHIVYRVNGAKTGKGSATAALSRILKRGSDDAARGVAAVVATGRSDYPNQINNVLAFPGVFRGLLDARARHITTSMLLRAAGALAAVVTDEQLNASYVVPSVFDPQVPKAVAAAVAAAAATDPEADAVADAD